MVIVGLRCQAPPGRSYAVDGMVNEPFQSSLDQPTHFQGTTLAMGDAMGRWSSFAATTGQGDRAERTVYFR